MAITKRILRLTNLDATVKVDGAIGSVTIALATDLKLATEDIATPSVSIIGMIVTGSAGGLVTIARNSVTLYTILPDASPIINLMDFGGCVDATEGTSDIVITTSNAESQLILKLRKTSGYQTKIRSAQTGTDTPV